MHDHQHVSPPDAPGLGVYAAEIDLLLDEPVENRRCRDLLAGFVDHLATRAVADGARVIGHIKAVLQAPAGGYIYASVTRPHETARCQGELSGEHSQLTLTVNALAFGVTKEQLRQAVESALNDRAGRLALQWHHQQRMRTQIRNSLKVGPSLIDRVYRRSGGPPEPVSKVQLNRQGIGRMV